MVGGTTSTGPPAQRQEVQRVQVPPARRRYSWYRGISYRHAGGPCTRCTRCTSCHCAGGPRINSTTCRNAEDPPGPAVPPYLLPPPCTSCTSCRRAGGPCTSCTFYRRAGGPCTSWKSAAWLPNNLWYEPVLEVLTALGMNERLMFRYGTCKGEFCYWIDTQGGAHS